ncbi:MAG: hypothetical protein ACYSW7_09355 [Planctomycetota bacterium]|jgi:hypothetical protein
MVVETGQSIRIGYDVTTSKYTDCDYRWLYGIQELTDRQRKPIRILIEADATVETLPDKCRYFTGSRCQ